MKKISFGESTGTAPISKETAGIYKVKLPLYQTLETSPTATDAEIGAAYRLLAKRHHPDMVRGKVEKIAKVKFQQLAPAYEVLKDLRKRRESDKFGMTNIYNYKS
jgi:DnaJ-class molecular chaperone